MKKALVIMAALVVIASLAFADSSMGTWGRTSFEIAGGGAITQPSLVANGFGGPLWPSSPYQGLTFGFSSDKAAFNFKLEFNGASAAITLCDIYATLKVAPDLATVMVGKFGSGFDAFRKATAHPIHGYNQGDLGRFAGYGIIVDVAPKDSNFETAVMWEVNDPSGATEALQDIQQTALNTSFGVSYTLPSLLKLTAGSNVQGKIYPEQTERNIFVRATLLAVTNLDAFVAFKYTGLEKDSNPAVIDVLLGAQYTMDALTGILGVDVTNTTPVGGGTSTLAWAVQPEVSYKVGPVTPGLFAEVKSSTTASAPIVYEIEPYVVINDFGTRISLDYKASTQDGNRPEWAVVGSVTLGF
jgi:hypothetical protein